MYIIRLQVFWVHEATRIDPRSDARFKVNADGSLTIREVSHADAGRYYCVAENPMGMKNSGVATLTVSGKAVVSIFIVWVCAHVCVCVSVCVRAYVCVCMYGMSISFRRLPAHMYC
jgi:hypothetical protein